MLNRNKPGGLNMNRNTGTTVAIIILVFAIILHFWWASSTTEETRVLTNTVAQLRDSLQQLSQVVDSLRAEGPGLGDFMSTIQLHAAKLWFAGNASNWTLAMYEEGELNETMEAAEKLHARKDSVDISSVLRSVQQTQLEQLRQTIADGNLREFSNAYSDMLAACNGCHRPAGYAFIHIIRPTVEPVHNQRWSAAGR
jgi:hypothetical protein